MSKELLAAVRASCPSGLWSQGVKLARDGAVSVERVEKNEATLRVTERGRAIAPTVILYPDDLEWDCDCGSKVDTCAHVAAAAITLEAGGAEAPTPGGAPSTSPAPAARAPIARIAYRFSIDATALRLDRVLLIPDGTERRLDLSITDRIARGVSDPPIQPTHDDLTVDRVMGKRIHGDVLFAEIGRVLEALSSSELVSFEGSSVRTTGGVVGAEARVADLSGGAVELVISRHRSIQKVVAMGVALTDGGLAPLDTSLGYGLSFEKLPERRVFKREELGELAAEIIRPLEKRMPVEIATSRLPRLGKGTGPRLRFELSIEGPRLAVMPLLVYGEPPVARIDAGRLVLIDRRRALPAREEARERALVERLRDALSLVPGRRVLFEGRDAARFAAKLEQFEGGAEGASTIEGSKRTLVPRLVEADGAFDLVFELDGSEATDARATAEIALWAHREGLGIVPLEGGGFAHLPSGFMRAHADKVADLLAAKGEGERGARAVFPVVAELADALGVPRPAAIDRLATLAEDFTHIPRFATPEGLDAELRPYQLEGAGWLAFLKSAELGALLADDMGLGKTLQTIAVLSGRVLVVCPRSVVHNWANEIARFRPALSVAVYEGKDRSLDDADVTLVTYGLMRSDVEDFASRKWDVVVLDEAQAIKNPDSLTARAALRLDARFRVALTGTPVENRLEELFSIMRFLNPGILGTRTHFRATYGEPIDRGDASAAARLRSRVRPFLLRRTKNEVLTDLPPLTETVVSCELEVDERAVYDAIRAATRKDIVESLSQGGTVLAALEALLRLRQAACHSDLVPGQSRATSTKVERLVEMLEESRADGHRALVFSQWTGLLDRVEPHLVEANLGFVRLDGSTRDREAVVTEFQAQDGPPVMLVSLKAGGTGLNLTAADHVFLLDPWWNPAVEEQAGARAHRIGQERPVVVHRLVAKDTVEERILVLQEKKRKLATVAFEGGGGGGSITREDLLALLE